MSSGTFRNLRWLFALMLGISALIGCTPTPTPKIEPPSATATLKIPTQSPTPEPTLADVVHIDTQKDEKGTLYTNVYREPPPAILEINALRQTSVTGTFCWTDNCADAFSLVTPLTALVVTSPIVASLHLPINETPDILQLQAIKTSKENEFINAENDSRRWWDIKPSGEPMELLHQRTQDFTLDLPPGLYILSIFCVWNIQETQRDVRYGFLIDVK